MLDSLYVGTVVSNSDYAVDGNGGYLGRVLVDIPGFTTASREAINYKAAGSNTYGTLDSGKIQQVENFERIWAYVLTPIMGESSIGKYNRTKDSSSLSDGTNMDDFGQQSSYSTPPATQFSSMMLDGFSDGPSVTMSANVNPYGNCYLTENYSDSGKGMFSVPSVNSKVLIGFLNGSRAIPIVLGKLNSGSEVEQIYGNGTAYPDYPNIFENSIAPTTKPETESKIVIQTPPL
jgi:hypothetical protein